MGEKEACIGVEGVMPAVMGVHGGKAANGGVMPALGSFQAARDTASI